jgi:hypothetical protein
LFSGVPTGIRTPVIAVKGLTVRSEINTLRTRITFLSQPSATSS